MLQQPSPTHQVYDANLRKWRPPALRPPGTPRPHTLLGLSHGLQSTSTRHSTRALPQRRARS
eukprot:15444222-Alexandrium_andersonii.AAC.1